MRLYSKYLLCLYSSLLLSGAIGCGSDNNGPDPIAEQCDLVTESGCEDGLVCEETTAGERECFKPLLLEGQVINLNTHQAISGARVVALDINGEAVSSVSTTDAEGNYTIVVSATRNPDGSIADTITLRSDAAGYQTYPGGTRPPFPIDLSQAQEVNGEFILNNQLTQIGLNPLPDNFTYGSVQGKIEIPANQRSVLVVAELSSGDPCPALPIHDCTGVAGADGSFKLFNLPAGNYQIRGFVQGSNHESVPAILAVNEDKDVGTLKLLNQNTGTLNGKINIVNPGQGQATSVILVLESTLTLINSNLVNNVPVLIRGAMVPGLRVDEITGDFTITGIPAGRYVVLAAYENDFLVRDPDTCISGTDLVYQEFAQNENVTLENPFKVTGALDNLDPDAAEMVPDLTPIFSWDDDSSEDEYQVTVLDSFGNILWDTLLPGVNGQRPEIEYAGIPLESEKYYQFHVFSIRSKNNNDCEISQTEDLRGTFLTP